MEDDKNIIQSSEMDFWVPDFFCAIFSFSDMVDFVFNIRNKLKT